MGTKTFQTFKKQMKSCFLLVGKTRAAGATGIFVGKCVCRSGQRHFLCFSGVGRPVQASDRPLIATRKFQIRNPRIAFQGFGTIDKTRKRGLETIIRND